MTVPQSTYRVQLHQGFGFDAAAAIADYLADLGVSHLYASPYLQATPGSTHGYDVVDPTRVNDELGGEAGRQRLTAALRAAGLGQVLDIVPNHLAAIAPLNPWWTDVLRHGPDSRYAHYFDIDWLAGHGHTQVLVPVLGGELDDEIEAGDLRLVDEDGELWLAYHHHRFPLRPASLDDAGLGDGGDADLVTADAGALRALLPHQHYELAHWRRANVELNYRRFFDIVTLAGVRVEDPEVFDATHVRVLEWLADGSVDGVRVDHPDGLRDPSGYFERLRAAAPDAWIVVEKILEAGERRRTDWPVDGTVGYEFAAAVLGLLLDRRAEQPLTEVYAAMLGERPDVDLVVEHAKRAMLVDLFGAELRRLSDHLAAVAADGGLTLDAERDVSPVLAELLVAFPVYRTYVRPEGREIDEADRRPLTEAIATVRARLPHHDQVLDLLHGVLTLDVVGARTGSFVARFQQLTGPTMAKGVEDTVLYRYLRFVAVNEVGSDLTRLGTSLGDFHVAAQRRQRDWPATMLTTSTHDTKRSEDVRARLAVLTEVPDRWVRAVERWRDVAQRHRGARGPSPNLEYLFLQTVVGAWPIGRERLVAYLIKAAREEKRDSSWLDIDQEYEAEVAAFVAGMLDDGDFHTQLDELLAVVVPAGRVNSLAQALVKLTAPGIPDVYQGCELWDLSLVDPDNRRPVDLDRRRRLLRDLDVGPPDAAAILARMDEGLPKLWITRQALRLRRERPAAFGADGSYRGLLAGGAHDDHVVAFERSGEVVVVVPRLVLALGDGFGSWTWDDTSLELPPGRWTDRLTAAAHDGGRQGLHALLTRFPVALLVRAT